MTAQTPTGPDADAVGQKRRQRLLLVAGHAIAQHDVHHPRIAGQLPHAGVQPPHSSTMWESLTRNGFALRLCVNHRRRQPVPRIGCRLSAGGC